MARPEKPEPRNFLLTVLLLLLFPAATLHSSPVSDLQPVGSATLRWMFWTVYHSTLYSGDGEFQGIKPDLALELKYRRDISQQQLLDATRDQWQELGVYRNPTSESWLTELARIWPQVEAGDTITLRVETNLEAVFFLNGEMLGGIQDPDFTRDFLAIWLDEKSDFPELRQKLMGRRR